MCILITEVPDYLSLYDFCPDQNPELSVENPYTVTAPTSADGNDYEVIKDKNNTRQMSQLSDDYITVL